MSRRLQTPTIDGPARRLDAPTPVLDQATRDLVARAEAEAYARGRADGARESAAAAEHAGRQAATAVTAAVDEVRALLEASAADRARSATEVGRRLAETILGQELQAGGTALLDRVLAAADALDHGPFTVHVAPVDAQVLDGSRDLLPADTSVQVDDRLTAGEARITGPWSGADLTRDVMLDVLLEQAP